MRPMFPLLLLTCLLALSAGVAAQSNDRGLDRRNPDAKTAACTDFYQHTIGRCLRANPVPCNFGSWGLFDEMVVRNLVQQREIAEIAENAEYTANQGGLGLPDRDDYLRGDDETKVLL